MRAPISRPTRISGNRPLKDGSRQRIGCRIVAAWANDDELEDRQAPRSNSEVPMIVLHWP